MALWGKTDDLAGTPKYVARKAFFAATGVNTTNETIDLSGSNTGFSTGDEVVYSINGGTVIGGLTDGTTYYVRAVAAGTIALYDTAANALNTGSTTGRVNITAAGVGTHTLQRTGTYPISATITQRIVFVDREESQQAENRARGLLSPGWWTYMTYTDVNSRVRHKAELLVAIDVPTATSGDGSDDTIAVDRTIAISVQPANATMAAAATTTFTVTAAATPTAALTYQWQVSTNGGTSWASVAGGMYTGGTTATLTVGDGVDSSGLNGYQYRVVVSSSGATSVTSSAATLTVTA